MLTENQKEAFRKIKEKIKLEDGGLNAKQKGDFYYRMSKILKDELEGLKDLAFLLDELPDSYMRKIDFRDVVIAAMKLTEELVQRIDPWPVGEHVDGEMRAFRVFGNSIPTSPQQEPGKCTLESFSYTASQEEIDLHQRLKFHLNKIMLYVDPCTPNPMCYNPGQVGDLMASLRIKMQEEIKKRPFSMTMTNHMVDERDPDGFPLPKFFMVDIDKLKEIRFRPPGLKGCMELRPLLKGAKLTAEDTKQTWEEAHPTAKPYPDKETMWVNARRAASLEKPK